MILLTYIVGGIMCLEDWRHRRISWWWIVVFCLLSVIINWAHFVYDYYEYNGLARVWILGGGLLFIATVSLLEYSRQKPMLGLADKILLPTCLLWLGWEQLPVYLILTGGIGVITACMCRRFQGHIYFPFAPSLLISLPFSWLIDQL